MIYVLLRILAYVSVPLIIGFAKKGYLSGKQCTLIAVVWALIMSTVIAFMTSGGAEAMGMIIGGTISGSLLGGLAIFLASRTKTKSQESDK